jgi:serine/threonine protein kinase
MTQLLKIGEVVSNRYRVEEYIGRGGMAEVYKVFDLDRSVYLAMKMLHSDLAEDRVFLRRFQREAKTYIKLQHPNIVRFYGLEQDKQKVYMLLDYIDGVPLRTKIFEKDGNPFTLDEIREIIQPICAALSYAHKQGFVHCDVKPANILVDKIGNVFLSDFGIARLIESTTITMFGAGTAAYMSPEQIQGKDPMPSMDIYSLGIVMYELVTGGERPFTGENAKTTGTTNEKIRWEQLSVNPIPPDQYNTRIPRDLSELVLDCLIKDHNIRIQTIGDLQQKLIEVGTSFEGDSNSEVDSQINPLEEDQTDIDKPGEWQKRGLLPFEVAIGLLIAISIGLGLFLISSQKQLNRTQSRLNFSQNQLFNSYYAKIGQKYTISDMNIQLTNANDLLNSQSSKLVSLESNLDEASTDIQNLEGELSDTNDSLDSAYSRISDLEDSLPVQLTIVGTYVDQYVGLDGISYIFVPKNKTVSFYVKPGSYYLTACHPTRMTNRAGCASWGTYTIDYDRTFTIN